MNGKNFVKDLYNTHPLYLPHQSHGSIFRYISIPTSRVTGWAVGTFNKTLAAFKILEKDMGDVKGVYLKSEECFNNMHITL